MLTTFLRTIITYVIVLTAVRLMGKREIGQLQPFELVVIIIIADVASVPMQNINIPLLQGIIPILALLVGQIIFSYLNIKVPIFHRIFTGKATVLIENGRFLEENLKKQRVSLEEVFEQMRVAGYPNISDIDYAILETSGEVSFVLKPEKEAVKNEDMNINPPYVGYPQIIVLEGNIISDGLAKLKKDNKWLMQKISERNTSIEKILIMISDESGKIYIEENGGKNK